MTHFHRRFIKSRTACKREKDNSFSSYFLTLIYDSYGSAINLLKRLGFIGNYKTERVYWSILIYDIRIGDQFIEEA